MGRWGYQGYSHAFDAGKWYIICYGLLGWIYILASQGACTYKSLLFLVHTWIYLKTESFSILTAFILKLWLYGSRSLYNTSTVTIDLNHNIWHFTSLIHCKYNPIYSWIVGPTCQRDYLRKLSPNKSQGLAIKSSVFVRLNGDHGKVI